MHRLTFISSQSHWCITVVLWEPEDQSEFRAAVYSPQEDLLCPFLQCGVTVANGCRPLREDAVSVGTWQDASSWRVPESVDGLNEVWELDQRP